MRASENASSGSLRPNGTWLPLLLILLAALAVRVYVLVHYAAVIENEGSEYALIADHLKKGDGYVGSLEGPEVLLPPLYPLLIAGLSYLTRDLEMAARLISIAMGVALAVSLYFLARRMYGERVALLSAALAAFQPLLVGFSAATYTEIMYLTLLFAGLYWSLQAIRMEEWRSSVLAAICFGLAYLTRPEALACSFLTALALPAVSFLLGYRKGWKRALLGSVTVLAVTLVFVVPYAVFLYAHTGRIAIEGKSDINYAVGQRVLAGMPYQQAANGIGKNLEEEGPVLKMIPFIGHPGYPKTIPHLVRYVLAMSLRNKKELLELLLPVKAFGSPLLVILVAVGLFRKRWDLDRLIQEGFLLVVFVLTVVIVLATPILYFRYTLLLLPFLILWAAKGIEEMSEWVASTAAEVTQGGLARAEWIQSAARWTLSILLILMSLPGLRYVSELEEGTVEGLPLKQAGLWLKNYMPGPKRIMTTHGVIVYYSGGYRVSFPYAEPALFLRYLEKENPDFLVLDDQLLVTRPTVKQWLVDGVPHPRARLVYDSGTTSESIIKIYRWQPPEPTPKTN